MLQRSTIQLLRLHFSFFLLPVFLFAFSQAPSIKYAEAILAFFILHVLVYPASNGYNSYMDADTTPVGGLRKPLQPTRQLFTVSLVMDAAALLLSLSISVFFALGILLYIIASRAYSYRGIRLKKFPITGFITVITFQGALVFAISYIAISGLPPKQIPIIPVVISSMLIGALYPLTQVYQHHEDARDGVTTISALVGCRGTFILSALFFTMASALLYFYFQTTQQAELIYWYLAVMAPVLLFFLYWMYRVWHHADQANFSNSMRMNVLASICTSVFFLVLICKA